MNYKRIHDSIINTAKKENRSKSEQAYFEAHHIIPRALGGTDDLSNLVLLTPREHFLVHYLLWKMNPNVSSLRSAVFFFRGKGKTSTSRLYEAARIDHIKEMKNNNPSARLSPEASDSRKRKLSKPKSLEHRRNISLAKMGIATRTGALLNRSSKEKISNSLKRYFQDNGVSDETRKKLTEAQLGKKHSPESIEKSKQSALARKKYECPHCERLFDGGNLKLHMTKNNFSEDEITACKMKKTTGR